MDWPLLLTLMLGGLGLLLLALSAPTAATGEFPTADLVVVKKAERKLHLLKALAIGFGVHICTIGMYFCTSRALYEVVPSGDLFVTSAMMTSGP